MYSQQKAADVGGKRFATLKRLGLWSVASAALFAPHFVHAEAAWSAAPSAQTLAIVEMNAARATPAILDYKNSLSGWTATRMDAAASKENETLAPALKDWAQTPLSGTRAAERHRRRLEIADARGNRPLWRDGVGFTAAANAAPAVLQEADRDGLNLAQTRPPKPEDGWTVAQAELALSEANMRRKPRGSASIREAFRS